MTKQQLTTNLASLTSSTHSIPHPRLFWRELQTTFLLHFSFVRWYSYMTIPQVTLKNKSKEKILVYSRTESPKRLHLLTIEMASYIITVIPHFTKASICKKIVSPEVSSNILFPFTNSASGDEHVLGHLPQYHRTN